MVNAIETIAIYKAKTRMSRDLMNRIEQQEDKVAGNASNKRKWEVDHGGIKNYGVTDIRHAERLEDLKGDDKLRYDKDIKAVNILLLELPVDVYPLINHYQTAKEIKDHVKELMEDTEMTKQERESMIYDEFDKFTFELG
nr:hypothetical protein [Tanacetum cinerariifolium]